MVKNMTPTGESLNSAESKDRRSRVKNIICCFDGTGNKFGEENSNIVRFLDTLVRNKPAKQVIYYQPGIGTYSEHEYNTTTVSHLFSKLDECLALFIDNHVKAGYKFIMQHYKPGDKICLFGFSRGAYIARVLMGMLYKVGLLPPDNIEQVDFAFSVYKMTGDKGRELSREFKKTFAFNIIVEFVGVWDTVASVGITPTPVSRHPYTSVDYATKVFRHALALDERRVRFQPQTWNTGTTDREQELDVDEPCFPDADKANPYDYIPPERDVADVKEVWFAGCHADIGGGSHHGRFQHSLSYIPFRWMILEARKSNCGILFDEEHLKSNYVFDARKRPDYVTKLQPQSEEDAIKRIMEKADIPADEQPRFEDVIAPIYDQLSSVKAWWALELLPLLTTYQTMDGKWVTERHRNLGDGRRIPFHSDRRKVLVHWSVRLRQDLLPKYTPAALNWNALINAKRVQWIDDPDDDDFPTYTLWVAGYYSFAQAVEMEERRKRREEERKKRREEVDEDEDEEDEEDKDEDEEDQEDEEQTEGTKREGDREEEENAASEKPEEGREGAETTESEKRAE